MTVGLDLSSLQSAHRMRGIGYTLINFINNIPEEARREHGFVFFVLPDEHSQYGDPLELLELDGLRYEVRSLRPRQRSNRKLRGKLQLLVSLYNNLIELRDLYLGDSRIVDLHGIDVFLQTDQSQGVPRYRHVKTALVIYDIIPYVLEWDYLWSYGTARMHSFSRKAALRVQVRRWLYAHKLRVSTRRADRLLAISDCTKQDFVKQLGAKASKIVVTPLGVNLPDPSIAKTSSFKRYIKSSWGYTARPFSFAEHERFILFVGGADHRRKLQDLVTAFNHLRAQGHDLKLVLAGDSMQGPNNISTQEIQSALRDSSYLDDIIFMGFIDDQQRDWLYSKALAFVFPSKYEGFGLPVLEAMSYGCPVISYPNAATKEVAKDLPIYAKDYRDIFMTVKNLLEASPSERQDIKKRGLDHVKGYAWQSTADSIINTLERLT